MFSSLSVRDTMADILSRLLRVPVDGKPLTIFDLSGVPSEVVDVVVSLLCRTLFDFAVWSERGAAVPVLLVCEEAHRYIPRESAHGVEPTRPVLAHPAQEGTQNGLPLGLAAPGPASLTRTIPSHC